MGYKMIKVIGYRLSIIAVFLFIGISAWGQTRHEIKAGETLYSISRTYGVTISAIQAANPGLGETIMTGQTINIPAKAAQEPQQHIIIFPETQPTQQQTVQQTVVLPVANPTPVITEIPPCKETYEVKKK